MNSIAEHLIRRWWEFEPRPKEKKRATYATEWLDFRCSAPPSPFIEATALELNKETEIGDGCVYRVGRAVQKQFMRAPTSMVEGKYGRPNQLIDGRP